MTSNPADGWTVDDFAKLCAETGIEWVPPSRGSHYKAASPYLLGHLTVPYKRPVKIVYVRLMCEMVRAHLSVKKKRESR